LRKLYLAIGKVVVHFIFAYHYGSLVRMGSLSILLDVVDLLLHAVSQSVGRRSSLLRKAEAANQEGERGQS
jgi:hypothetical protein